MNGQLAGVIDDRSKNRIPEKPNMMTPYCACGPRGPFVYISPGSGSVIWCCALLDQCPFCTFDDQMNERAFCGLWADFFLSSPYYTLHCFCYFYFHSFIHFLFYTIDFFFAFLTLLRLSMRKSQNFIFLNFSGIL